MFMWETFVTIMLLGVGGEVRSVRFRQGDETLTRLGAGFKFEVHHVTLILSATVRGVENSNIDIRG
jgi:hypothetical protein